MFFFLGLYLCFVVLLQISIKTGMLVYYLLYDKQQEQITKRENKLFNLPY